MSNVIDLPVNDGNTDWDSRNFYNWELHYDLWVDVSVVAENVTQAFAEVKSAYPESIDVYDASGNRMGTLRIDDMETGYRAPEKGETDEEFLERYSYKVRRDG